MPDKYPGPPLKLYGTECTSWFDGSGLFHVKLPGDDSTSTYDRTLDEAVEKMKKIILSRRAKLDVQFTEVSEFGKVRNGTVTALHAGNGNPLVKWEDGEKQQLTSYRDLYPRLTAEQAEAHAALSKAKVAAERAYTESRKILRGAEPGNIYSRAEWSLDKAIKAALEGGDQS